MINKMVIANSQQKYTLKQHYLLFKICIMKDQGTEAYYKTYTQNYIMAPAVIKT